MWGTKFGTAVVGDEGTWSWTRPNMGTYTWQLDFVQDKGTKDEARARLRDFAPNENAVPSTLALTNPDAAQLAAGYAPNMAYTFRGTGKPNSTITVENIWGTGFGTTTVDPDGTWAWTRTNMGTYTWKLNFIQDKGTPAQETVQVSDFKPTSNVSPVQLTSPSPDEVAAGYTPNAPFTFEGTGTKGKTITIQNKWGTKFGTAVVDDNGTWSWTRPNMGTYTWQLDFVQEIGTDDEARASLRDFAPRA
jgi:hypothetical protein